MSTSCCHLHSSGEDNGKNKDFAVDFPSKRKSIVRRLFDTVKCAAPGVILIILPKCPVCLAAWISVATGFGISISAAGYLRSILIIVCVGSLFYFVISRLKLKRWRRA